jgi:hypothetical protein
MSLALLLFVGCATNETVIRPPKPVEEFIEPPDEARYTGPVEYPKEVLDEDMVLKKKKKDTKAQNPMGGMRGGPGGAMRAGGY